jgi:SAM-dependent methyltransferase
VLRHRLARLTDPNQFDLTAQWLGRGARRWLWDAKTPGAVGLDISPDTEPDIVHDPNAFQYPLDDASSDRALVRDVIEHVRDPIRIIDELHRVLRPDGRLQLRTPHFSSALAYGVPSALFLAVGDPLARAARVCPLLQAFRVIHVTPDLWLPFRVAGIGTFATRFPDVCEKYVAFRFRR